MSGWLLDGQQRIAAFRDFSLDEFPVFGDVYFSGLTKPQERRFLRTNFSCYQLPYTDDEKKLREIYDRLNFGGTPHTDLDRAVFKAPQNTRPRSRE